MAFFGYLIRAIALVLNMVLTLYMWIIIARAILSWVNPDPYNPIVRFIYNITEPVLSQIGRRVPLLFGGFDFSPIIILIAIAFINMSLVSYLEHLGRALIR